MTWSMMEANEPPEGSLLRKLGELIPREFPDGFSVEELLKHHSLNEEEREEIRWHQAKGALMYGLGNGIYCQRQPRGQWEVIDYRSRQAMWLGAVSRRLGLGREPEAKPDDPKFLVHLQRACLKATEEMGPPTCCYSEDSKTEKASVYFEAARMLQKKYTSPCDLSFGFVTAALSVIGIAKADKADQELKKEPGTEWPTLPLCRAAWEEDLDRVKRLLEKGSPVDDRDLQDNRAIDLAAIRGNLPIVQALVTAGSDVKSTCPDGLTVLHSAMESCNLDVVKYLVEIGADVRALDNNGTTPLHLAAYGADPELLEYLIEQGADVNALDGKSTPLDNAYHACNRDVVRVLKKYL